MYVAVVSYYAVAPYCVGVFVVFTRAQLFWVVAEMPISKQSLLTACVCILHGDGVRQQTCSSMQQTCRLLT
jgi:hypothetical protein